MYFQAFFIFDRIKQLAPQHPEWKDKEPFASVLKGDFKSALAGGWPRHLWAFFALFLAPPIEEFIFRGVLFTGLSNKFRVPTAALIVTLVFVLMHATEALSYWPAWMGLTLLGSATILFRHKTGSLLPAIGIHASYNFSMVATAYIGTWWAGGGTS